MANRYANIPGTEKISDTFELINDGFDKVEQEMDAKADAGDLSILEGTVNAHIGAGGAAHAEATTSSAGFMAAADKQKLDTIEAGAQVNQNAYAKVNGMEADDPSDEVTIEGGTGITVTQNPNEKKVTITATGEATPGPHGSSHLEHGSDPIPYATETEGGLMSSSDKQFLMGLESIPGEVDDLQQKIGHYEKILIEEAGTTHAGGYGYTAFSSGANIQGKEVYVARCAPGHMPEAGWGKIVAYIRGDDGRFTSKVLDLDYSGGDYRDPNITADPSGNYLILTSTRTNGSEYIGFLWLLDANLDVVSGPFIMDETSTTRYFWGNTLVTPSGKLIKCAYQADSTGGVYLYRSSGSIPSIGTFSQVSTIANPAPSNPNETTIAYWGDRLVAIIRQNGGYAVATYTKDLEGDGGWTGQYLSWTLVSPALEPYINGDEPLIVCSAEATGVRRPWLFATKDFITWTDPVYIDEKGAYPAWVRSRYGFGCMYYEEIGGVTNLCFRDVDVDRYIGNLSYLRYRAPNAAKVRRSSPQSIPSATLTPVEFDVALFDPNKLYNNNKFTVKEAGYYIITGGVGFVAGTGRIMVQIHLNGQAIQIQENANTESGMALSVTTAHELKPGDVVELKVYSANATSLYVSGIAMPSFAISKTG